MLSDFNRVLWSVLIALYATCALALDKEKAPTILYNVGGLGETMPCGCRTENYGGFPKRMTLITEERKNHPVLLLEVGSAFLKTPFINKGEEATAAMEQKKITKLLKKTGIDAFVPGEYDIKYFANELKKGELPVVLSNVLYKGAPAFPTEKTVTFAGKKMLLKGYINADAELPEGYTATSPLDDLNKTDFGKGFDAVIVMTAFDIKTLDKLIERPDAPIMVINNGGRKLQFPERFRGLLLLETPNRARYLGKLSLALDGAKGLGADLTKTLAHNAEIAWSRGELDFYGRKIIPTGEIKSWKPVYEAYAKEPFVQEEIIKNLQLIKDKEAELKTLPTLAQPGFSNDVIPIVESIADDAETLAIANGK